MKTRTKIAAVAAAIGIALAGAAYAHGPQQGGGWGGPGMGWGGPGMMGPGMMGGWGGQGMMGPGMMGGQGMMGGWGGPGIAGMPCPGQQQAALEVTPETVTQRLERHLQMMGNERLKVGSVAEADGRIVAEIVTQEGALVDKFAVDSKTGAMSRVD